MEELNENIYIEEQDDQLNEVAGTWGSASCFGSFQHLEDVLQVQVQLQQHLQRLRIIKGV